MSYFQSTSGPQAGIEVICGSMFSGKTEELIRRIHRAQYARQRFQIFKPKIDDRYSKNHVASHSARKIHATTVNHALEILDALEDTTRIVAIDEVQFFDASVVEVAERLANRGLRVIAAGLDLDFKAEPFGPMPHLMAKAESVTKLSAVCMVCGGAACRTQRVQRDTSTETHQDQILVGGAQEYEARCRHHYDPSIVPAAQIPQPGLASTPSVSPPSTSH